MHTINGLVKFTHKLVKKGHVNWLINVNKSHQPVTDLLTPC